MTEIHTSTDTAVVMLHGIYLSGWAMSWLTHKLEKPNMGVHRFSYRTLRASAVENAACLHRFLSTIPAEQVHLVAHSLGGLVVRHLFQHYPEQRPGRVVTLGTPHNGSHVAKWLNASALTRPLLGRSVEQALLGDAPPWSDERELGVIAGTNHLGMGKLIPGLELPNDGTVAVAETRLSNASDHVTLPVSHNGMLLSASVVKQIHAFLENGRFDSACRQSP